MRPLTLLDPSYFGPFFLNFWREWPAQWANKYVLVKIFNFKPTFGVSVTLFLRYGCFDMAYENKAFLTNSVIPRPNRKFSDHEKWFLTYLKHSFRNIQKLVNIRIACPRNALWRAILRRAILSMSFIRIARPIYFVFMCWYDLQLVPNVV